MNLKKNLINPITKGLFTISIIILISLFGKTWIISLSFVFLILLLCLILKEDLWYLIISLKKIWLLILLIGVFQCYSGNSLSIVNAINTILKIIGIYFTSILYTKISNQNELLYFWEIIFKPLSLIKISPSEIALVMVIAIRFLPVFLTEIDRIKAAQVARGIKLKSNGLGSFINFMPLLIPVLHQSLRRSEELADAMEVRGYNPTSKRGRYKKYTWGFYDFFAFLIIILIIVAIIY